MAGRPTQLTVEQQRDLAERGFSSIAACAKAHGMAASTLSVRLRSGLSLEEALTMTQSERCLSGAPRPARSLTKAQRKELAEFGRSIRQLAAAYGISESTVFRRLHSGMTVAQALSRPSRTQNTELSTVQREELWSTGWPTLQQACVAYDQPYGLVRDRWLRLNWPLKDALTKPSGPTKPKK